MSNPKRFLSIFICMFVLCFVGSVHVNGACVNPSDEKVAEVVLSSNGLNFMPKVSYHQLVISVARADGTVFRRTFDPGSTPYLDLSGIFAGAALDGTYTYELRVIPAAVTKVRKSPELAGMDSEELLPQKALTQTGSFLVQGGMIIPPGNSQEGLARTADVPIYDDVIITGSLCVGSGCADGERFGYCLVKLKENNLQLCFEDNSVGTYPSNDWKIQFNDTTSGGASYFTLWDVDHNTRPFTIEAGAPDHSLYVEDYGRVGLGTSIPVVELHIVDGDTPTIRLEQDSSYSWPEQRWDLSGNETHFFIRDTTNYKQCFRIQPNTPGNTLCMRSTGYVGIGTWSPAFPLEVETTGENASIVLERTSGASAILAAGDNEVNLGSLTNHEVRFVVYDDTKMVINTSGYVGIGETSPTHLLHLSGGAYSDGSTWQPASSRQYKENIAELTLDEAIKALEGLNPVKFNYKINKEEDYIGFIAEDVPELVATKERKSLNTMDVVAVLTKVVKDQQKLLKKQQEIISQVNKRVAELEKKSK